MNCQDIVFSQKQSQKRIKKALRVIPSLALKKILFFSLYILGAKLNEIAYRVEMPKESGKTTINRVMRDGITAFHDRRHSVKTYELQSAPSQNHQISALIEDEYCIIIFGDTSRRLSIPLSHKVHLRSVLLSLCQANVLTVYTVASILGITAGHCRELSEKLINNGVTEVLIDKRKGQKQDFLVDLSVKAELIQHFAARAVTGHSVSSQVLTELINDAQKTAISSRTIRWHMNKLGLTKIKKTLPDLVEALKKKLRNLIVDAGGNLSQLPILLDMQPVSRKSRRHIAVILINNGYAFNAVAGLMKCSVSTVARSLKRINIIGDLTDLPRSGRPVIYSETFKLQLTGFYCQTQPFPNSGRWTLRWAAAHLAAHPQIVNATPSKSTIQRILKENNLKPHQSRYFLHITDPDFFPKMEHLIQLYLNPPKNLFFFDECPGIQMLKRLVPDLRTEKTAKRLEEFEYIRNGTMNVLAFFNYANGKVYAECQADHKTDTFLAIFKSHVSNCPANEPIHYVMDNLSTHRGYPFCKTVAELSGINCPSEKELDNLEKRVQWLTSPDKRIVIHFTPYHGSWLNLIEFWFGIMNKKVSNESYGSPEELKESFEAFFVEWNTLLAHPFQWSYDGKGLHKKVINRFTEMLKLAANRLEISTLTKQLRLASNLFDHYFKDVPVEDWENLFAVLQSQETTVRNRILNEDGPRKKHNAENALNEFLSTIEDYLSQNIRVAA